MHIINLPTATCRSPEYVGCEPVDRATWLVVLAYCIEQENGGVIQDCREWGERRWMSTCAITKTEALRECELFWWVGDDLHVAFYPLETEALVKKKREAGRKGGSAKSQEKSRAARDNGKGGGRPSKPKQESKNPSTPPSETQAADTENSSETQAETQHKDKIREREGKEKVSTEHENQSDTEQSKPLCTIEQARSAAPSCRMSPEEAEHWWHIRERSGWTIQGTNGGAPRNILSWRSDMAASVGWVKESLTKNSTKTGKKADDFRL